MENSITTILRTYLSSKIPQKITNILWQMFVGIEAAFMSLESKLDLYKRERNIKTAQLISSLSSIAAQNGFEPTLKIPAQGLLKIIPNAGLFNRTGYPLFIKPYAIFTNKLTKIEYYYSSANPYRLTNDICYIPVIEGKIKTVEYQGTGNYIESFYLSDANISQNSIIVEVQNINYTEVKSFYDNDEINDGKQFMVKFSTNPQKPIILYVKGCKQDDIISCSYRLTSGELGNIYTISEFETSDILDSTGMEIEADSQEIQIINQSDFFFGSNGTDINSLRSAIGYNHGINLLFDSISYTNYLSKYSNIILQKIINENENKQINHLYIFRKQALPYNSINLNNLLFEYNKIIENKTYLLSLEEKNILSNNLEELEYCLSSSVIHNPTIMKFAFQITIDKKLDKEMENLKLLLYQEFAKFFHIKHHILPIEQLFQNFMLENKCQFEYLIFNDLGKEIKVIKSDEALPIIKGDFNITDSDGNIAQLFFDINIVKD